MSVYKQLASLARESVSSIMGGLPAAHLSYARSIFSTGPPFRSFSPSSFSLLLSLSLLFKNSAESIAMAVKREDRRHCAVARCSALRLNLALQTSRQQWHRQRRPRPRPRPRLRRSLPRSSTTTPRSTGCRIPTPPAVIQIIPPPPSTTRPSSPSYPTCPPSTRPSPAPYATSPPSPYP